MKILLVIAALGTFGQFTKGLNLNAVNSIDDQIDALFTVEAMAIDTEKIRNGEPLNEMYAKSALPEVCYESVGCFSKNDSVFDFIDLNPISPEKLNSKFYLTSRHNKDHPVELSYINTDSLTTGFIDPNRPTFLISHGFNENSKKKWVQDMKNLLLAKKDSNVIMVDWGSGATLPYYGQAIVNSELVARQLSLILQILVEKRGLVVENIHGIGYSLGAHLMGMVGKNLIKKLNRKVARITGLDPAGLNFEDKDGSVHLSTNDATFVDIIHSSAGTNILLGDFGIIKPIGHVDFYPNGGKDQPGCSIFSITCHHQRGVDLFIESLSESKNDCVFKAYPCPGGLKSFKEGKCTSCEEGSCGVLGYSSLEAEGRGSLYLKTNGYTPYCMP